MNPLALKLENVRTFPALHLQLPTGCTVIGGENGAGKSTVLNAIDVALFAGRGELPPLLTLGEDELRLELEFEHQGERYRVRRGYSAKGRGKTILDLERCEQPNALEHQWEPLTRETADQTQQHLEQILGLSRATFRASSFLAQGDAAAFTEASPRDRKQILAEVLGLSIYDRLLALVRGDLRVAEDEKVAARARTEQLHVQADRLAAIIEQVALARVQAADAEAQTVAAQEVRERAVRAQADNAAAVERARAAKATLDQAAADTERARQEYARSVQAGLDREQRQADLDEAAQAAGRAPELEQRLAAARAAREAAAQVEQLNRQAGQHHAERERIEEQIHARVAAADELDAKAAHLEAHIDEAGACDRCGQTLGREAAMRAAASFRTEAAHVRDSVAGMRDHADRAEAAAAEARQQAAGIVVPASVESVELLEARLRDAHAAVERRAALAEQVRQLAESAGRSDGLAVALAHAEDARTAAAAAYEQAAVQVADERKLQAQVDEARVLVEQTSRLFDERKADLVRLGVEEQQARDAAGQLQAVVDEIEALDRRVDVLKLAERAFGRDGIPALVVENAAIPQLELEANRILGELGGATAACRVELRTQRALKTTEALRETLDIVIVTPAGERAYETFSGGERTRLNLALRIALARLLAHRRGADSRLLAIDEPDGLDAQGMDALAGILSGLGSDFDRVLVVSHQPQLATSFDQAIIVTKDGDRSRIDTGAATLEAVGA